MAIPSTIPILGLPWDDVLFVILAGTMLLAGLLVVTMRDIIRCGLAMMVCFGALAGIYVMAGAPLVAGAQVLVYIGAISVLVLTIGATQWGGTGERGETITADLARVLFADWVLPFEIVGVLLLAAVIGGVFLAKRDRPASTDDVE